VPSAGTPISVLACERHHIYDVENGPQGWTGTGLWHITARRANTPTHSWWYGWESTVDYDTGSANAGALTSPLQLLPAECQPALGFTTWWEIESADPQARDLMQIQVSNDHGATWQTILQLNPGSYSPGGGVGIPYSSAGLNRPGIWRSKEVDLGPYRGRW